MSLNQIRPFAQRTLAVAFAGTLAVSACLFPAKAHATSSDEIQQQLTAAKAELDEMQKVVAQADADLEKTVYELDQTKNQISDLQGKIDENEVKLGEARKVLSSIIEETYKQGGEPTLLELVLSSENFDDLMSRIHYANKASEAKQEAIKTVSELQNSLNEDKASLEEEKTEQEQLLVSQEEQKEAADAAAAQQADYINGLDQKLVDAIAAERAAAAEASKKAAEEAKKREAEEAKKREAEAAQQQNTNNGGGQQQTTNTGDDEETTTNNGGTSSSSSSTVSNGGSSSGGYQGSYPTGDPVSAILSQVGCNYGHGNIPGVEWDCSGLTAWAWGQAGHSVTPCSGSGNYGQFQICQSNGTWKSDAGSLVPGDVVFYSYDGGNTCYHVAMYIGGGQVCHAIDYGHGVQVTDLFWCNGFCGGGCPAV